MDWRQAIEILPETASFYYNLALIFERKGMFKKAIKELQHAINLKPKDQEYQEKLGKLTQLQQQQ
jgi:tetratricopeptide (TPR) repeat protein